MEALDSKVFNPWNANNKDITQDAVTRILRAYGWKGTLKNFSIFQKACIHKSYVNRPEIWAEQAANTKEVMEIAPKPEGVLDLKTEDNEELEFGGDSILDSIVALYLLESFPGEGEGFMTKLKTRIVNNAACSHPPTHRLPLRGNHGVVVHARSRASNSGYIWKYCQASSRDAGEAESQLILERES